MIIKAFENEEFITKINKFFRSKFYDEKNYYSNSTIRFKNGFAKVIINEICTIQFFQVISRNKTDVLYEFGFYPGFQTDMCYMWLACNKNSNVFMITHKGISGGDARVIIEKTRIMTTIEDIEGDIDELIFNWQLMDKFQICEIDLDFLRTAIMACKKMQSLYSEVFIK